MIQNHKDELGDIQLGCRNSILSALQTEFSLMRGEIGRLMDYEKELHQMSVVTLAAVLAFIGVFLGATDKAAIAPVLLLIPFASLILALTAASLASDPSDSQVPE